MIINIHSKPLTPGPISQLIRKKIIVKGAKTAKSNGHIQELNIEPKNAGLSNHQMNMANLGPKIKKMVITQHTLKAFQYSR